MKKTTKVTFNVYGTFSHGAKKGQTNPKAHSLMTFFGDTVKDCIAKVRQTEAFYTIFDVSVREFRGSHG